MTKKTEVKKHSMKEALESGIFTELDGYATRKAGIQVKVAMKTDEYKALGIDKMLGEKRSKPLKALLNAVGWTIVKCQANGIPSNVVVAMDAAGFPPLAMGCVPWDTKTHTPVIVVGIRKDKSVEKEVAKCPTIKSKAA